MGKRVNFILNETISYVKRFSEDLSLSKTINNNKNSKTYNIEHQKHLTIFLIFYTYKVKSSISCLTEFVIDIKTQEE